MWQALFPKLSSDLPPVEDSRDTSLSLMNMALGFVIWSIEVCLWGCISWRYNWVCLRNRCGDKARNYCFYRQEHGIFRFLDSWDYGIMGCMRYMGERIQLDEILIFAIVNDIEDTCKWSDYTILSIKLIHWNFRIA